MKYREKKELKKKNSIVVMNCEKILRILMCVIGVLERQEKKYGEDEDI